VSQPIIARSHGKQFNSKFTLQWSHTGQYVHTILWV